MLTRFGHDTNMTHRYELSPLLTIVKKGAISTYISNHLCFLVIAYQTTSSFEPMFWRKTMGRKQYFTKTKRFLINIGDPFLDFFICAIFLDENLFDLYHI